MWWPQHRAAAGGCPMRATGSNDFWTDGSLPESGRVVALGLGFTESPIAVDDVSLLISSVNRGAVYKVFLDDRAPELIVECGGGPNGITIGSLGQVFIAQNGGMDMPSRSVLAADPSIQMFQDGTISAVISDGINAPSDCVTGADGSIWFTDPADHELDGSGKLGSVRSWQPSTCEMRTRLDGLQFPNGITFGTSPDILFIAETAASRVRRYRVAADEVSFDGWSVTLHEGRPDGLAVDRAGWLWVAASSGNAVFAYDCEGTLSAELRFPDQAFITSVGFAGPNLETLIVTSPKRGAVIAIDAIHPGMPAMHQLR